MTAKGPGERVVVEVGELPARQLVEANGSERRLDVALYAATVLLDRVDRPRWRNVGQPPI
jgi:hypothetical protein